jgi:uncharacterized protein (TIGR00369 family)
MTTPTIASIEKLQALAERCPFNHWLGIRIVEIGDGTIEVTVPWRPEIVGIPDPPTVHGGILATILDFAASNAIATRLGQAVPTVDLRIDYHRVAKPGELRGKARVIQLGRTLGTVDASAYDCEGTLIASGRGTFFCAKIAAKMAAQRDAGQKDAGQKDA